MRRTTRLIAAAGISAGLSLTACGDDTAAALSKPETADAEIVGSLLDDMEATVDEFTSITRAAADGDAGARELIDDSDDDPMAEVNQRAREYGLTVCGAAG